MKKMSIVLFAIILLSAFTTPPKIWKSEKFHKHLGFSIGYMGITEVHGQFKTFEAHIKSEKADFSDASIELSTEVASINTDVDMRDEHLRSADFFDVAKFPVMTFKSTSLKSVGKNKYKLTGDLTLHGITKPVTLDMWYRGTIEHPMEKTHAAGVQIKGSIKRSDFAVGDKFPAPMLSDVVEINADGAFVLE